MHIKITNKWNHLLGKFLDGQKDIYYTEEYVNLYSSPVDEAFCIVCKEHQNILLMPFLRRKINGYFDFETPYGYGGPISNTYDQGWINYALEEMASYFKEHGYLCGFIRFHPLIGNAVYCKYKINVSFDRHTVFIDTGQEEEDIWKSQIISKNRNMIRKAEKNGLVFKADDTFASLPEFIALYNQTMQRLNAENFYFFSESYYKNFLSQLGQSSFLGTVYFKGKLICAALFMFYGIYGHYHLEGSDPLYAAFGANNFLLWHSALELKRRGVKQFHLGGGSDAAEDNSLLKFKKAFSGCKSDFYIGRSIFHTSAYETICKEWEIHNAEKRDLYGGLLLKYRY